MCISLTPIEDADDAGTEEGPPREPSGVRQRLTSLVTRIGDRVTSLFTDALSWHSPRDDRLVTVRSDDDGATSIKPGWSGKLENRPSQSPKLPEKRRGVHSRDSDGNVSATLEEDRLTIRHEDNPEEYISSDVYERIER